MAQLVRGGRKAQENFGQRLGRNIAKVPALAYEAATTGFGLGNVTNLLADRLQDRFQQIGIPEPAARVLTNISPLRLLNTSQQARSQAGKVLPRELVESRRGDEPYEFALRELPFHAASTAAGGLPGLLKSVGTSAGMYAGSLGGESIGKQLGKSVGEEQLGSALGSLGGGLAGAVGSHALMNRPSQVIPEKLNQKIENKRTQGIQDIEQVAQQREGRVQELETSRNPEYTQAETAGKNIFTDSAPELKKVLNKVSKQMDAGIERTDLKRIGDMTGQIERFSNQKRININDAVNLKQNLNASLYDRNLPPVVRRTYTEFRNALNEFINRVGTENPEHGKPFSSAESKTVELKKLKKETPQFQASQKEALKNIEQEYKQAIKSPEVTSVLDQYISPLVKRGLKHLIVGTGSKLLGISTPATAAINLGLEGSSRIANEASILKDAFKNHPDIYKDYTQLLKSAISQDIPRLTNIAAKIDTKLQPKKAQLVKGGRKKRS